MTNQHRCSGPSNVSTALEAIPRPRTAKVVRGLLVSAVLLSVGALAVPEPAECVWCPTYTCYGPCGASCLCIAPPGQFAGHCYGVQAAERARSAGLRVLR